MMHHSDAGEGYTPEDLHKHTEKMRALYDRRLDGRILVEFNIPPPPHLRSPREFCPNVEKMFEAGLRRHEVRRRYVDDFYPTLSPPNVSILLAAVLGAAPFYTADTAELWMEPIPELYTRLDDWGLDGSNSSLRYLLSCYAYYESHRPADCFTTCTTLGPDDIAKGLRGTDLFYDFADHPDGVKRLFLEIADFSVEFRRRVLGIVSHVDGGYFNWQGFWVPDDCISVTADAATNYSQATFEEFTVPAIERMVGAAGGRFEMHLEGSAYHIIDAVSNIPGLILLEYTNNPKWPRGVDMIDKLRAKLETVPLKLLLTKQEFLDGMQQGLLPDNCIYAVGYDTENPTDTVDTPEEAREIMAKAREYRSPR